MKKFVMGLIVGMGIMFSFSAYAAEVKSLVGSVIEGQFNVTLDGVQLEEPALVVNGTSYLPVRAIADAMGLEASFDAEMGVKLKKKPVSETTIQKQPSKTRELIMERWQRRIEEIEEVIKHKEEGIEKLEPLLQKDGITDEERERLEETIELRKKEIEELKAEKAELEAKLEGTK